MKISQLHRWSVSIEKAKQIQLELIEKIRLEKLSAEIRFIAGADVSYASDDNISFAAITILKYPEMEIIEQTHAIGRVTFPYVPGYLTFREAPVLLKAFEKTSVVPDLVLFDGQGIAHPRRMGIATHLGIILAVPTIGCAKSILCGEFAEPLPAKGNWAELSYKDQQIGAVVRTRDRVKPVFVSPGFKITFDEAVQWTLATVSGYRIPEPIRQSHLAVNQLRIQYKRREKI